MSRRASAGSNRRRASESPPSHAITSIHLRSLHIRAPADGIERFPFNIPAIASAGAGPISLDQPVTILAGENGSGKSTLLEGIASAAGSITVGAAPAATDPTLAHVRDLARAMRLTWARRTHRGFFLRAEDFFGFANGMNRLRSDLVREMDEIGSGGDHSDYARTLAKSPFARELGEMERRYGDGLDARSHGESFLTLFQDRFVPDGLYLLDEPEAPLSPRRQLALIAMLHEMTTTGRSQFIIATHSPILMSIPGAAIYSFDDGALDRVDYDHVEHVALTRQFLDNPNAFLRHLWTDEEIVS